MSEIKPEKSELKSGPYAPGEIESKWTDYWFEKKLFDLRVDENKPCYSIALPPPNITGNLHMGHALNGTLQDILTRLKRMQGYNVLWQPGTDHAGISTQMVVDRKLKKEHEARMSALEPGQRRPYSRHDIGREKFIEHVWVWRKQYGDQIMNQYKRLGVSFSWDRPAFTMDDSYVKAIYRAFVSLYDSCLIYRGNRITNWCPQCQTSLSDLEVEHKESKGHLYHLAYKLDKSSADSDDSDDPDDSDCLTIATTRPETIFADVAVCVHPEDPRYKHLVGRKVRLPLTDKLIPVIEDDYVERDFGTGVLKITPAHDANDWEVGQRHALESPVVIDEYGKLKNDPLVPEQFQGKDRFKAREEVVTSLQENGLLALDEEYTHGVGHCERCGTVVEPYLSDQWYLRMKDLAEAAIAAVEEERVQFIPQRYANTYLDWMRNIRDWNISRQLWWGHRIPVWTCQSCGHEDAFESAPLSCEQCASEDLKQDEDVLDTWFSSALWPFATLGWPEQTMELRHFYPTTVLSTAREIINLWVARMIFMSLRFLDTIPFKHVLIHPVIQTHDGKRMSKSKGNAVDPLDMIDKYGADANRFWFTSMGVKGDQDVRFREEKLEEYKKFVNKLWNAGRFVLSQLENYTPRAIDKNNLTLPDRWILSRYNTLLSRLQNNFANYDFEVAARDLYEFIWDHFCDWYLEIAKIQISTGQENEDKKSKLERIDQTEAVLATIFEGLMRALHPVMPYVTEELWSHVPKSQSLASLESIMFAPYPRADQSFIDEQAENGMAHLIKVVRATRNIRQTFEVPARVDAEVLLQIENSEELELLEQNASALSRLAKAVPLSFEKKAGKPEGKAATETVGGTMVIVPLEKLIDVDKTRDKLIARKDAKAKEHAKVHGLLNNGNFRDKAPKEKVATQEALLDEIETQIKSIESQLSMLDHN